MLKDGFFDNTPKEVKTSPVNGDYLAQYEPMRRAKIIDALERTMRLDGVYMPRYKAAEILGAKSNLIRDEIKNRLYTGDDGCFYSISQLTKTCVDYALFLQSLTQKGI